MSATYQQHSFSAAVTRSSFPRPSQLFDTFVLRGLTADVADPVASRVDAARIYFDCRRKGLTVRSAADCLIAQIALERDFSLLHDDCDFEAIGKVRPLRTVL